VCVFDRPTRARKQEGERASSHSVLSDRGGCHGERYTDRQRRRPRFGGRIRWRFKRKRWRPAIPETEIRTIAGRRIRLSESRGISPRGNGQAATARRAGECGQSSFVAGENKISMLRYITRRTGVRDQRFVDLGAGARRPLPGPGEYGEERLRRKQKLARQFGVLDNFYDSGAVFRRRARVVQLRPRFRITWKKRGPSGLCSPRTHVRLRRPAWLGGISRT